MNGFKIFRLHAVSLNIAVVIENAGDVADKIFHEFRVLVSLFRDKLFIDAF